MTNAMYQEWLSYYLEAGGSGVANSNERATEMFRQSALYESYFPGIKREDGSIRYASNPEQTYFANISAFRNTVEGLGMQADVFNEDYIDLIEGDTSPSEFESRANSLYDRVLSSAPDIRDYYAENFGVNMSDEGILASLMSTRVEQAVFDRQLSMSEIGGEASVRNFDITTEFVGMLEQQGMERREAQRFFGSAEALLPVLGAMAARYGDPDDTFDIMEFAEANVLGDPTQRSRISRLMAQEESAFTGGASIELVRDRSGGVAGLATS